MLSADELERYARHIVLREVGGPGQAALKEASVLVIGAGGLGAPALMYLAAAGVGTLGVVDDDVVSLSNLQRQIIHTTPDIGRRKVDSAGGAHLCAQSACHVRGARDAARCRQCDGADRRLRPRARRLGQFRDPLSGLRRLLSRRQAADHGSARHVRRIADHDPRARAEVPTANSIRPTAACFPKRRRRAPCRPAPRPA